MRTYGGAREGGFVFEVSGVVLLDATWLQGVRDRV